MTSDNFYIKVSSGFYFFAKVKTSTIQFMHRMPITHPTDINERQKIVINAEKTRLLYSSFPTSFYASIAASIFFSAAQWPVIDHDKIIIWLSLHSLFYIYRLALQKSFNRKKPADNDMALWSRRFLIGTGLAGVMWGLGFAILFPTENSEYQLIVVLVALAMAAGAMTSLGIMPKALILFNTPLLLPVIFLYYVHSTSLAILVIPMLLLSYYFFIKSAMNISDKTDQNLLARLSSQASEAEKSIEVEFQRKKLQEMERVYQVILDNNPNGVTIVNKEGRILLANKIICNITGYKNKELVENNIRKLMPDRYTQYIFQKGKIIKIPFFKINTILERIKILRINQSEVPVEITISPLKIDNEEFSVIYFKDKTREFDDRIRINRYKHIADNSPDLIALIDTKYKYRAINEPFRRALDKDFKEVIGKSIDDIYEDKEGARIVKNNLDRCFAGENIQYEASYNFPGIVKGDFIVTYHLHQEREEYKNSVIVRFRDITEENLQKAQQLNLEKQLFNSQKMEAIGVLTAGIAHDFNNILASILGHTELLLLDNPEGTERQYLDAIEEGGKRGKDLIEKMLSYTRNKPSEISLHAPEAIIQKAVNLIRPALRGTVKVTINNTDNIPEIFLDPAEFEQVIINFCLNARDAMNDYGKIIIDFTLISINHECDSCHEVASGDFLDISVSDTGSGIPKDILNNIFDPFFTTKEEGKGTGLGLSMAHGIIHNARGHIYIDSSDNGTTFHLLFPLPQSEEVNKTTKKINILVIDDDLMVGSYLKELLTISGYIPKIFSDSEKALIYYKSNQQHVDLIITDQVMPGLTGLELSDEILLLNPEARIIIISGFSKFLNHEIIKKKGIMQYFSKPLDKDKLLDCIDKLTH